jgi:translation initiation factor IF-2
MPYEEVEIATGALKVLARFRDNRKNVVLGGRVEEGLMEPKRNARVMRGEKEIATGSVTTVRRGRDEVRSVGTGSECGLELDLGSEGADVKVDDTVHLFRTEQQRILLGL